ncbi:MAG: pantetheine-phosphate adenylyltransferase [Candidatus Schekmanbacteria bacterium RBG_13_48_7]|uniref:Phosphopantetheine adenylyltransferase n=1 Tax=Candidatus Schekmanbacteria bacterium RBG_13_48_7 TaxID=1817878 RepID=A0A1F7RSP7_9BACT|nr:MAG: pantetheine-phosphate adenylyltransferase [Candidatus Schekmanbacteria bacterium RBG_13_48_7]
MDVTAVYPGSFDPLTNGHLDLIVRGSKIFSKLIVAVTDNPSKTLLFSPEERIEMIREAVSHFDNVVTDQFHGLLVNYLNNVGGRVILRGLRAVSDFEFEFQMALMNRRLCETVETIFMMPHETYSYLSSGLVKEICALGGDISGLVPSNVKDILIKKLDSL